MATSYRTYLLTLWACLPSKVSCLLSVVQPCPSHSAFCHYISAFTSYLSASAALCCCLFVHHCKSYCNVSTASNTPVGVHPTRWQTWPADVGVHFLDLYILIIIIIIIIIMMFLSQEASGTCEASQLPPDRLVLSITGVVVQLQLMHIRQNTLYILVCRYVA